MAFSLPFGIKVSGPDPVDSDRYVQPDIAGRDSLKAANIAYQGLQCFVVADATLYILKNYDTNTWEEVGGSAVPSNIAILDADQTFTGVNTFAESIIGNIESATRWQTGRTISLSGAVTGTSSIWDGTDNASMVATVVDDSHNHTHLENLTVLTFVGEDDDSAEIRTKLATGQTTLEFYLKGENNNDYWAWRFKPAATTEYDAMTLTPVGAEVSNLWVSGSVIGANLSGVNTGDQDLSDYIQEGDIDIANVAYKNIDNNFSTKQTIDGGLTINGVKSYATIYENDYSSGLGTGVNNPSNTTDWVIGTGEGVAGTDCMKAVLPTTNLVADIDYTFTAVGPFTRISFDYKQTMEGYPWDSLRVLVNGIEVLYGENTTDWVNAEVFAYGRGEHTVTFRNYTDGGSSNAPDTVWIDNLLIQDVIAPTNVNTDAEFSGLSSFRENAVFGGDIGVSGKTYLKELSVDTTEASYSGSIRVQGWLSGGSYRGVSVGSSVETFLNEGETVTSFAGGGNISTSTVSNSPTYHRMGAYVGDDGVPYSYLSLARDNKTTVLLSAQGQSIGGTSVIGSKLHIGFDSLFLPDPDNTNTFDVNGNIVSRQTIAQIDALQIAGELVVPTAEWVSSKIESSSKNIEGGSANTIYLQSQIINGGNAVN